MTALSRPGVRIAAFVAGLGAVFGLAFGIGRGVGPWDTDPTPGHAPTMNHGAAQNEGMHR
ncbi:hypothetical protein L5G28_01370 [Gordonia sp. HY285]|uniref:Uncharacterized protein n=1 Tax=Gordonia liuliyuniae TaxID=2911517 RepID=A0ABS9IP91_9ACTN|nr:hypothetical protein [Gordonia liuliyuniae]MCF8587363.1 hypothetical protein [Gordonia liuliyuniae]MCF8608814.1 hypothetical protein [Gordonia liuliyuniae]